MTNFRIIHWKYCNICGSTHETEYCSFLQNVEIVRDTFTLSRARLSLPEGLEVVDYVDGSTSVIARNQFKCGVQFGPMIARKTSDYNVTSDFPIKIFSEDVPSDKSEDWMYLDTTDEHLCNWMCLVAPANCLEEQNLICFQMKNEIYFLIVKDVEPGEHLHVWYAPHYGVEMLAKELESSTINVEDLPVHVEEPTNTNHQPAPASNYHREKKKKRKLDLIAQSMNYSPELRDQLASKLPSAILGAKNPKSEWDCAKCAFKSKLLSEYAKHLISHCEAVEQYECCSCKQVFTSSEEQKNHIQVCKKAGTQNAETENPEISPSVDELNKNGIESNNGSLTECAKRELDHSDMSNVLDSLTDSTSMKKMLLTDSSRLLPCSGKDSSFSKEYDILLDSITDFGPDSSNITSDSNLLIKINLKNDPNNVDNFIAVKTEETNDTMSVGAQTHVEMESDHPPILGLGDEIVFQNLKSFAAVGNEVDKNTDFSNGLAYDGNQSHLQINDVYALEDNDKSSKTDQTVDSNDLDLDLLCQQTLHVTGEQVRLVDNLIKESEKRLNGSEINNCSANQNFKNASATSSIISDVRPSEFVMKLNPFEEIDLTLDFGTSDEKIITDKELSKLDKIYNCEICNKKFSKPLYLRRHLRSHTGEFTCLVCLRVFSRKESLEKHICSDVTMFRCKLCCCDFKSKIDLKNHLKQHSNEGNSTNKGTWSRLSVRKVVDRSQVLLFSNNTDLSAINNETNGLETSLLLDCNKDSIGISKDNYVCELCGADYTTSRGLSYHRLAKHYQKTLSCHICDKKFHRKNILVNHMTSHVKMNKVCSICKKVFCSEKTLKSHMRRRHSAQQPSTFKCDDCGKTFSEKYNLRKHKNIICQNNKKLDNCRKLAEDSTCTQQQILKFNDNHPLKRRNKTGNRRKKSQNKNEEYICRYCHTILNNRNSINRHLRVKHQNSKKEWSVPEVVDSMRVVVEEATGVSTAEPVSYQVDLEPSLAVVTADESSMVTNDSEAAAIQPSTSDAAEIPSDPLANQLPSLDYAFTLKTENNQNSDVIGYQPLMQPLNAAELFQIEGSDNTPALILEDGSVAQPGIPLDKELFYLVFTPEAETIIPICSLKENALENATQNE